jgi:hypothetical protein
MGSKSPEQHILQPARLALFESCFRKALGFEIGTKGDIPQRQESSHANAITIKDA